MQISNSSQPLTRSARSAANPVDRPLNLDVIVSRLEYEAEGVVSLLLTHADGQVMPAWSPGAHIDVAVPSGIERQYSLCGDPADLRYWRIAVLREPESRGGSEYICTRLREGDSLRVCGPRNNFPLVVADSYLFIAGGIGITPILPMVEGVERLHLPWRLLYGGRRRDSMAFLDRLRPYTQNVTIWPQDSHGLLDLGTFLGDTAANTVAYSCGPEPLLAAIETETAAWAAERVHMERFKPRAGALDGPSSGFVIHLDLSDMTVEVGPDESIAEALDRVGVAVATSCREGTCGTCETAVLDGIPDHRDSFLTPQEQAENTTMMICCSRAQTSSLTLDL